jgi:hypothetical protein
MQSLDPLNTSSSRPGQGATSAASSSPASRQKSCNACVRGKRRCDKTAPRCTRCAAKGLECVYQRVPPGSSPSSVTLAGSSARPSDAGLASASAMSSTDMSDDFEMGGFDVSDLGSGYSTSHSAATTTTTTTSPDSLTLDPNLDFSIADLLNGAHHSVMGDDGGVSSGSLSSLWSLPGFTEPKADFPSLMMQPQSYMQPQRTTIRDLSLFEECQMTRKCVSMDPLLIHDPRSSIGFMFQYMSNMHVDFVQTRSLPFSHPRLYSTQVPKTMMAAFCAAATYAARTPSTKAWAVKAVQDAANAVHSEGATATTPLEKLARCQALLVIDSIRIFDGDLGMRYAAERGLHILRKWAEELVQVVHELSGVTSDDELHKCMGKDHLPPTWDVSFPPLLPFSLSRREWKSSAQLLTFAVFADMDPSRKRSAKRYDQSSLSVFLLPHEIRSPRPRGHGEIDPLYGISSPMERHELGRLLPGVA